MGRPASATGPDGQTAYGYDLANNLTSIEDPRTKLQFGYNAAGRVTATSAQDKIANLGGAFTYTYDAAGNRLAMTASGYTWSYSYDALNRPVTITAPGGTQFQFTYDAAGRRTRMDMGAAVAADYVYDAANQLTGITYRRKADNAVIAQVGYTYDNAGNRATMADDFGSHGFAYDDLHRLTSAVHPSSGALTTQSETFAYDAVGNRMQDAVRAGYAYDAANRLNSDSLYTYNYDNNGNLTTKTRTSDNAQTAYIYDAQNRLTQVNLPSGYSETLRYDATGRRIAKTITHNGETIREQHYIYDGEDIAFVTDAAGALKSLYTHGPGTDEPLMLRKGASDYYLLADGLGSIIAIADQTGSIAERAQYQAYGRPVFRNEVTGSTSSWSQTGSLYSYTAREWDAETGLFYYRARYYAPDIGRFIQKDPIGFNGGDTNLYAYVGNRPNRYIDPTGLVRWGDLGNASLGAVSNAAGIIGGAATISAFGWTGIAGITGGAIALKSAYGLGANLGLMGEALLDMDPTFKGSLLGELAYLYDPCNKSLQNLATAADLGIDLLGLQVPKYVTIPNKYWGGVRLLGGGKMGDVFYGQKALDVLGGGQAVNAALIETRGHKQRR
ncbi:MAG: RHS repeat-associated core domain-containing protein [Elusimicrobiales bacterium]